MEIVRRGVFRAAWLIAGLAVAFQSGGAVLRALVDNTGALHTLAAQPAFLVAFVVIPVVGAFLVRRVPMNVIGYVLLVGGLLLGCWTFFGDYGLASAFPPTGDDLPWGNVAGRAAGVLDSGINLILPLLFLLFPTGRLLSTRWRWVLRAVLVPMAYFAVFALFAPFREGVPYADLYLQGDREPQGVGALLAPLAAPLYGLYALGLFASVISQFIRYRRADRQTRLQIKWFALAGFGIALCEILLALLRPAGITVTPVFVVYGLFAAFLPVAIAVAILKYRLYGIDIVINKTIIYGGLAAFVTAMYTLIVVVASSVLGSRFGASPAASIAATAVIAILFAPAKTRLERVANRVVYGHRVTPYEVLSDFSSRIAGPISVDEVLPRMAEAAGRGFAARVCRVGLLLDDREWVHAAWPHEDEEAIFTRSVPVLHQGEMVGEIALAKPPGEQMTPAEEGLLEVLASQAGPAMKNVRLTTELRRRLDQISHQAAELAASRRRLVTAQDRERRKIERDIHDGVQQDMIGISIKLQQAKRSIVDPQITLGVLEELDRHIDETGDRLRSLARGVFPSLLSDRGVAAALRAHIDKHFPNATLIVDDALWEAQFELQTEAAVYFCCLEALQNVSRYAQGAAVRVVLELAGTTLRFVVEDEGPGFDVDATKEGSGLLNMKDRVSAIGGTVEISSGPGRGTRIAGLIEDIRFRVVSK